MSKINKKVSMESVLYIIAGILLSTFSQACFLIPNKIVPSGLVGLGTILYHYAHVPIGLFIIANNTLLILLQGKLIGFGSSWKTIIAILIQGTFLDLCTSVFKVPRLAEDPILASVYGGVLTGMGIACIFKGGATLGGTDILAQLLLKFKRIPIGTTFFWSDVVVLAVAGMVYGPNLALYALIKSFILGQTVDNFMEGSSIHRQIMIISNQSEVITWSIIEELHRGVTVLNGRGAYSNKSIEILLTAVRRREVPLLEELVYRLDPMAFLIVTDARRILGKGFDDLESEVDFDDASPSGNTPQ
ncbi:MAG: YitT family protein [Candidatus Riflebacteria bacterium]|nr:YitT family protein [Candidatus Riflebacteria bacterium]